MRSFHLHVTLAASALSATVACATTPSTAPSEGASRGATHANMARATTEAKRVGGGSPSSPRYAASKKARAQHPGTGARATGAPGEAGKAPCRSLYGGGGIVAAPKVVPVIFPGNQLDAQVRQFFTSLQGSHWWQQVTAEYGIGPITTLPVYVPTGAVPTVDTIDQWIADLAASPPAGFPAADDNTIYAIVLPEGWQQDAGVCVTFGGYHAWNYPPSGQVVIHTVNPTCAVPLTWASSESTRSRTHWSHEIGRVG